MATDGGGDSNGGTADVRASVRQWAPYVGLAAVVFAAGAAAGAVTGGTESSAFVPAADGSGDATGAFQYLASAALVMLVGGVFVTLPTLALLGVQGYQFGGALAGLAGGVGPADALALAAPPAAFAVPALWLVAAVPLRGLHYAARMVLEARAPAVPSERLVAESVAMVALSFGGLYLAATLAAGSPT